MTNKKENDPVEQQRKAALFRWNAAQAEHRAVCAAFYKLRSALPAKGFRNADDIKEWEKGRNRMSEAYKKLETEKGIFNASIHPVELRERIESMQQMLENAMLGTPVETQKQIQEQNKQAQVYGSYGDPVQDKFRAAVLEGKRLYEEEQAKKKREKEEREKSIIRPEMINWMKGTVKEEYKALETPSETLSEEDLKAMDNLEGGE